MPPTNLQELQQKLAQQHSQQNKDQHRISTASLPPIPTFEQQIDHRRMSTTSQPAIQEFNQPSIYQQQQEMAQTQNSEQSVHLEELVLPQQENALKNEETSRKEENLHIEETDISATDQVSEETSTSTEDKPRRRRSSKRSAQQLVVQSVDSAGTVECQLLCKQKTISFKFNRFDTSPSDIVEGLVKEELLKSGFQKVFIDQLKDVIRQLKDNPDKVPVVNVPYVQKVSY